MKEKMNIMDAQKRKFLIGLEKLSRETGVIIAGCGCCGSPWLDTIDPQTEFEEAGYGSDRLSEVAWISSNFHLYDIIKEEK